MTWVERGEAWRVENHDLSPQLIDALPKFRSLVRKRNQPAKLRLFRNLVDAPLPPMQEKWDWRTRGVMGVPRDQTPCNACSSFAVVAAAEALHYIKTSERVSLSPGFIHSCLLERDCYDLADPMDVLEKASAYGITYSFPGDYPFPVDQCSITNRFRIGQCSFLSGPNETMACIASHGPVVADMYVGPSFVSHPRNKIYQLKADEEDLAEQHAVCVVGYHQTERYWIVMNSYGPGWADNGFTRVAFESGGLIHRRGAWKIVL